MGRLVLLEVFDSFDNPLPFKFVSLEGYYEPWGTDGQAWLIKYTFTNPKTGDLYEVNGNYFDQGLEISFKGADDFGLTNTGIPFAVLSTVANIVVDMFEQLDDDLKSENEKIERVVLYISPRFEKVLTAFVNNLKKKIPNISNVSIQHYQDVEDFVGLIITL